MPIKFTSDGSTVADRPRKQASRARRETWNWSLFRQCYVGGMEIKEIIDKFDAFTGLSATYAKKIIYENQWNIERREQEEKSQMLANETLTEHRQERISGILEFALSELDQEMAIIKDRPKSRDMKSQKARLDLLEAFLGIGKRTGVFKDQSEITGGNASVSILVAMQKGDASVLANAATSNQHGQQAKIIQIDDKNGAQANLDAQTSHGDDNESEQITKLITSNAKPRKSIAKDNVIRLHPI